MDNANRQHHAINFKPIRHSGMDPTNNESERVLRKVVIHRKIRQKLVTAGGKAMFGTIMTCLLTWDKQGLNWFEKLSEVFWATQPVTWQMCPSDKKCHF